MTYQLSLTTQVILMIVKVMNTISEIVKHLVKVMVMKTVLIQKIFLLDVFVIIQTVLIELIMKKKLKIWLTEKFGLWMKYGHGMMSKILMLLMGS